MTYSITPLPLAPFRPFFALDDDALERRGARRIVADKPNTAPCRVSLVDAEPGERLILLNHAHLTAAASPYRATGPILVREAAVQSPPAIGALPAILISRLLSLRAYDGQWMMTDAEVAQGEGVEAWLAARMADPTIQTIHIHTARRGCYLAAVHRRALQVA